MHFTLHASYVKIQHTSNSCHNILHFFNLMSVTTNKEKYFSRGVCTYIKQRLHCKKKKATNVDYLKQNLVCHVIDKGQIYLCSFPDIRLPSVDRAEK